MKNHSHSFYLFSNYNRAASNHSRAASNAFRHGDHISAHQLSQQAREEWAEAEKLNAKAAKEILMLKNANNDMSKLDLHGLHALEAVHALEERLSKIESTDKLNMGSACKDATTRPRQNILHVITGTCHILSYQLKQRLQVFHVLLFLQLLVPSIL